MRVGVFRIILENVAGKLGVPLWLTVTSKLEPAIVMGIFKVTSYCEFCQRDHFTVA